METYSRTVFLHIIIIPVWSLLMSTGHWSRRSFPLLSSECTWWGKRKSKWCWGFQCSSTLISFAFELQSFGGAVMCSYISTNSHVSDMVCQTFWFSFTPTSKPRNGVRITFVWRIHSWMRKCVSKWEVNASTTTPASPADGWRPPSCQKVPCAAARLGTDMSVLASGDMALFSLLLCQNIIEVYHREIGR